MTPEQVAEALVLLRGLADGQPCYCKPSLPRGCDPCRARALLAALKKTHA